MTSQPCHSCSTTLDLPNLGQFLHPRELICLRSGPKHYPIKLTA
uniref:Uncharacterized protein n=1 Tax=Anguilla anguilla TaxID=7936 RepID=A0A0E9RWD8_ANGAN